MAKTTTTWNKANFKWNVAPTNTRHSRYTWDEISLVKYAAGAASAASAVAGVAGDDDFIHPFFDRDPEKKDKLVKLICKVQGKTIKKEKEIKDYKITVKDIQLLTEEVLGINVTIL